MIDYKVEDSELRYRRFSNVVTRRSIGYSMDLLGNSSNCNLGTRSNSASEFDMQPKGQIMEFDDSEQERERKANNWTAIKCRTGMYLVGGWL